MKPASLMFPPTVDLSRRAATLQFRLGPIVVLSPHFDDACYSLGSFLSRIGRGTLINVFTQGIYLVRPLPGPEALPDQRDIYEIRDGEDAAFAKRCGLTREDLGCEEPMLRGRRVHDLRQLEDDIGQIEIPILRTLDKIASSFAPGERGFLFAPLGVGGHVNHRATAETVLRHLDKIRGSYDILFYEDLPYSSSLYHLFGALKRVGRHAGGTLSTRYVLAPPWHEKKALIALYPTQQRGSPRPWRFWPRATWPLAPHEAFWSFPANDAMRVSE